jgi:hypothetical protein
MEKQTAVEYLFEQLWEIPKDKFTWCSILEKAKEMEKQQIIDAFNNEPECDGDGDKYYKQIFENYYKETYENK